MNFVAALGASALVVSLACALVALGASLYGHRAGRRDALAMGRRAIYAVAALNTLAISLLAYALLTDDFSIAHVASVSSSNMQTHMKWASLWSGQPGSLLFWTWMMSVWMAAFVWITVPKIPWGAPHAVATAGAIIASFLFASAFFASPFRMSPVTPADGQGLNPLLVDPGMLIHPPFLLTGLVSTAIPFIVGAAALMAGKIDNAWIRHARGWALGSFLVLGIGNVLGGWWAYTVLGWGGYWGWDPVENSAILPLLPLVGFLHALVVQERRGMLKAWNLVLVLAAFALAVFGTFNVRSGLVASVHSFAQSEVGPYFLVLVGMVLVASVVLMVWRLPRMHSDYEFESLVSRETGLILNTYVMVAIALVVLGGTLFPVFSELFRDVRITVGPPFYNDAAGPLLVIMMLLMGIGTILPWRKASPGLLQRRFAMPLGVTLLATAVLIVLGVRDVFAVATLAASILVIVASLREYAVGTKALRTARGSSWPAAFGAIFNRDPSRYGGYLVHIGVAVMAIAVIATNVYQEQHRVVVSPGETFEAGGYTMRFERLSCLGPGCEVTGDGPLPAGENGISREFLATVSVLDGDEVDFVMQPGRRVFANFRDQPTSVVALHTDVRRDLYMFVQGWDENALTELQVFVNPLQMWLWIGAGIFAAGGLLAFAPFRSPRRVEVTATEQPPGTQTGTQTA